MDDRRGATRKLGPRKTPDVTDEINGQRTVAAVIDTATGAVISRGALLSENQYDETLAIPNPEHGGCYTGKQGAEFIPDHGRCAKHDKTVVWSKKAPLNPIRIVVWLGSYRNRLGKKGSVAVSIGLILLLTVGMIGTLCQADKSDRERHTPPVPVTKKASISVPTSPVSIPVVSEASTSASVSVPNSKMAADALVEGRLDEALKRYGVLKAQHPEKQPYVLIVDILSAFEKGRRP